jgi:mannosyltransferase
VPRALIALTALAAALRLPTLGAQSLWLDEVLTGNLARGSLGDLFHVVAQQEANPPLFYLAEWLWTRVAGTSELALRLPSAVCGIALVPVAWGIGRRLGGQRAAVALAALVAVHPLLLYYSQEARGYAAVALACALGFMWFLDGAGWKWAAASAVALGCHYFAIFPVAIEAVVLLWRRQWAPVALLAVLGAALLPLLTQQLGGSHGENVTGGAALAARAKGVATSWVVGERGPWVNGLEWLGGALLLAGVAWLIVSGAHPRREAAAEGGGLREAAAGGGGLRAALWPAVVGGGGALLMLLAAVGGADYLNNRNTLPVLAIVLAIPALGFAIGRTGAALGAGACAVLLASSIGVLVDPAHAREDWRATAKALGPGAAVIVSPPYEATPLRWYRPDLGQVPSDTTGAIDVLITDPDRNPLPDGALDEPPSPGFVRGNTTRKNRILIARYHARHALAVHDIDTWAREHLGPTRGGAGAVLLSG